MEYAFSAKLWVYGGTGAWHFVTVPKAISSEIRENFGANSRGWGSLRVSVAIGDTSWRTSIFYDSKTKTYLLPVKKEVRTKLEFKPEDTADFALELLV